MFLFRLLDFVLRIIGTLFIVVLLQISIGGKTLEQYLLSFLREQKVTTPIQEMAQSGATRIKKDVVHYVQKQIEENMSSEMSKEPVSDEDQTSLEGDEIEGVGKELLSLQNRHLNQLMDQLKVSRVSGFIKNIIGDKNSLESVEESMTENVTVSKDRSLASTDSSKIPEVKK